jgi:ankyrin repeat protein
MKIKNIVLLAVLLCTSTRIAAADNLSEALQKGLLEEEANHNLDAAIQAYQSVINQFDDQRKIAATAVFRLGECYRKQGKTNEAVAQYQRLLQDFSDQDNLVGLSEKTLAALGRAGNPGEGAAIGAAAPTVTDPDQLKLLEEEIKLVEKEIAATEARFKVGKAEFVDIAKSKEALFSLQRQLPENATSAAQKSLLDQQIQLVERLLTEKKKQIAVGAAPPLDTVPLERKLLGLKRELIAISKAPSTARIPSGAEFAAARHEDEEAKLIQHYKELAQNSPDLLNAENSGNTPLLHAATENLLAVAKFLIEQGADVNRKGSGGDNALLRAAQAGHKAMVELLLDHQANVNAKTDLGITPLHQAASKGFLSIADVLLAHGADSNAESTGDLITFEPFNRGPGPTKYAGATPLHCAAASGYLAVVKLLLEHKADENAKTRGGCTPLYAAADFNRLEVVKLLLAHHADPNLAAIDGTPLGMAVRKQNVETVKALLAAGANVNAKGVLMVRGLAAPLAFAARSGNVELLRFLLQNKADVNIEDDFGKTPLYWAVEAANVEKVKLLLESGADPNIKDKDGNVPFQFSAFAPNDPNNTGEKIDELLLAHKLDVNATNEIGRTLLSLAAEVGDKELVELLVAHGADVNARNKDGRTALDWIKSTPVSGNPAPAQPGGLANTLRNRSEIADLLRKHGAKE